MKKSFDKGDTRNRKVHKDHDKVRWAYRKAQKNLEIERTEANLAAFKEARKVMLSTPHLDEMDENYKRLQYNRYADDFLISITGSKQDAENIKEQVKIFLKDKLNLTMSEEKTHVTQMDHVNNAPAGHGLIKVGGAIVPFINDFPKDTELYRLMSTKPGEG